MAASGLRNVCFVVICVTVTCTAWAQSYPVKPVRMIVPFVEFGDRISPDQLKPKHGYIELPTAPGLGIEIDEEALKKFPGKVYPARNLRYPKDEGP